MMLRINLRAVALVFVTALLPPVIAQAAVAINYPPACSDAQKTISIAQDKTITICPAAKNANAVFPITYQNGPTECSAYITLTTDTAKKTVTINCASVEQLFKIENPSSTSQNAVVGFKVSRLQDKVGNDTLTLTIPETQGHFTTDATGTTPRPTPVTVTFGSGTSNEQTIYAKITTSSGNINVSASGSKSSGVITSPTISVAQGCGAIPTNTTIIDIGELPATKGFDDVFWWDAGGKKYQKWSITKGGVLAVKFRIRASEPDRYRYTFGFMETSSTNFPMKLAFSLCPGVFDHLASSDQRCVYQQPAGGYSFSLLTESMQSTATAGVCQLSQISVPNTYYLNMVTSGNQDYPDIYQPSVNTFYMTLAR